MAPRAFAHSLRSLSFARFTPSRTPPFHSPTPSAPLVRRVVYARAPHCTTRSTRLRAQGLFPFELDVSPDSFAVQGDPIADRGESWRALIGGTAGWEQMTSTRPKAAEVVRNDTNSSTYLYEARQNAYVLYLATKEGGSIFDPASLIHIRNFENEIRALPSFPGVCKRDNAATPIDSLDAVSTTEGCLPFTTTPTSLGYATASEMAEVGTGCCTCGQEPVGTWRSAKYCVNAAPLCHSTVKGVASLLSHNGTLRLLTPNGNATEVATLKYPSLMGDIADVSCS